MWHDEAALVLNVIGKGFGALLGRLYFHEAASPLFLWIERAVHLTLGDTTYAMRLVPFLASCAALVLFAHVTKRMLPPVAVAWAVALFAFSDSLLWHASEAKPYAVDVLSATVLLAIYGATPEWTLPRKLLVFAALAPVLIFLTYPGCFLFGGLLVSLIPEIWQTRERRSWLGYGVLVLAVSVSFLALVSGPVRAQRSPSMDACWVKMFLPWERPWTIPWWITDSTLDILRYACMPIGKALILPAIIGAVWLYRRGSRDLIVFLVVPIGLALVASCLHAYPFGGARVLVYACPAIFILIAAGVPILVSWLGSRSRLGAVTVVILLVVPAGHCIAHVLVPWARADCAAAARYVKAHRSPPDAVLGNGWEYLYYFRNMRDVYQPLETAPLPTSTRVWLILTGATAEERVEIADHLALVQGPILDTRDFERTKVVLLDTRRKP
jgi:hypothetical protein